MLWSRKYRDSVSYGIRDFLLLFLLEMTIWGGDLAKGRRFYMTAVQPLEEGARRRRRIDLPCRGSLLRDGMKWNVRSPVLSYRHPERSRGIFYALTVSCTHEEKRKTPRCFGCFSSHTLPLTVVQGRFLATLEMTMRGKTLRRGGVFA